MTTDVYGCRVCGILARDPICPDCFVLIMAQARHPSSKPKETPVLKAAWLMSGELPQYRMIIVLGPDDIIPLLFGSPVKANLCEAPEGAPVPDSVKMEEVPNVGVMVAFSLDPASVLATIENLEAAAASTPVGDAGE